MDEEDMKFTRKWKIRSHLFTTSKADTFARNHLLLVVDRHLIAVMCHELIQSSIWVPSCVTMILDPRVCYLTGLDDMTSPHVCNMNTLVPH